jgi:glutathione synthase/RimK-type ligase-like ATP-grasp enzyme
VAIHSDALDYRGHETGVEAIALTEAETDLAIRAAETCGMPFSGVDLIRAQDGLTQLLECNPSPMFAAIEDATGVRVADPLAAYLAALAARDR